MSEDGNNSAASLTNAARTGADIAGIAKDLASQNYVGAATRAVFSPGIRKLIIVIIAFISLCLYTVISMPSSLLSDANAMMSYEGMTERYSALQAEMAKSIDRNLNGKISLAQIEAEAIAAQKRLQADKSSITVYTNNTAINSTEIAYTLSAEIISRYEVYYSDKQISEFFDGQNVDISAWLNRSDSAIEQLFKEGELLFEASRYLGGMFSVSTVDNTQTVEIPTKIEMPKRLGMPIKITYGTFTYGTIDLSVNFNQTQYLEGKLSEQQEQRAIQMQELLMRIFYSSVGSEGLTTSCSEIIQMFIDSGKDKEFINVIDTTQLMPLPVVGSSHSQLSDAQDFGPRTVKGVYGFHKGSDFGAAIGTPILSPTDAIVVGGINVAGSNTYAQNIRSYGNYIVLYNGTYGGQMLFTIYAHCSTINVSLTQGTFVAQGTQIATVGNSGYSSGPHLHFEVVLDTTAVDSALYFN